MRIPEDQTKIVRALGQVTSAPGRARTSPPSGPGNHYATIHFWPQEKGDEVAARAAGVVKSYTWQFTAGS